METLALNNNNSNIIKSKSGLFFYLCNIIIFFLAFSSIYPPIQALSFINYFNSVLIISWYIIAFLDHPKFILNPTLHRFAIYVYVFYSVLFPYIMGNYSIGNRFVGLSQIPLFYLAYQKNKLYYQSKANHVIILGLIPIILITSLVTIRAYLFNPLISRLVKETKLGFENMSLGIGGYAFVYFLVICVAILLYIVFDKNLKLNFISRGFCLSLILLFSINIQMSNYSAALYLLLLSFIIFFFFNSRNTKASLFYSIIGIISLSIVVQIFFVPFLDLLINLSLGTLNTSRFMEIKHYFTTSQMGDSIWMRVERWSESLETFWKYPMFGVLQKRLPFYRGYLVGFGQHSQFLDVFALFGFGVGMLQLYVFSQPIFKRIKNLDNSYSGVSIVLLVLLIILFTINNATPSIGFALFFVFPTIYDWKQKLLVKNSKFSKQL